MNSTYLICLAQIYSAATGRALTTIGKNFANHGAFFSRLIKGHTITEAKLLRVAQKFSDRWPANTEWPAAIPRPPVTPPEPEEAPAGDEAAPVGADGQVEEPVA